MGLELRAYTQPQWIACVLENFDSFLLDHASAERKASAMAVSFVVQYPDKYPLHTPMIRIAREELLHYQQVMQLIHKRRLIWKRDEKDPYIGFLLKHLRTDRRLRLLDRLLVGGIVEARGVERFGLVGGHLEDEKLKKFYLRLSRSEENHADTFIRLADIFFGAEEIEAALDRWLDLEAEAVYGLAVRPALH